MSRNKVMVFIEAFFVGAFLGFLVHDVSREAWGYVALDSTMVVLATIFMVSYARKAAQEE